MSGTNLPNMAGQRKDEVEKMRAEIKRLNDWADGMADASLKERACAEECLRELRVQLAAETARADEAEKQVAAIHAVIKSEANDFHQDQTRAEDALKNIECAANATASAAAEHEARMKREGMETNSERLNFVLENTAFLYTKKSDTGTDTFQLWTQDEDENFIILSGEDNFYPTANEAIDAAIRAAAKEVK